MRRRQLVLGLAVVAALVGGCDSATPIPDGAQQVRILIGDGAVLLQPATVEDRAVINRIDSRLNPPRSW